MQKLRELYLRRNRVRKLPASLAACTRLEAVYLEDNELESGPDAFPLDLHRLHRMQGITLQRNRLTAVPPAILQWRRLQELYLDDNAIAVLPDGVCELTDLRELSVAHNCLRRLPRDIGARCGAAR